MANSRPRIAIITGGQGDLARVIADCLEESGYRVHAPGRAELDVTLAASVGEYFAGDALCDGVDLLINNAGVRRDRLIARLSEEDWDTVLDTNLKGGFLCARAALKIMFRQRRGHIVNIGSHSALSGPVGQCAYAAAKAGLIGLTKSIALEGGRRNVRANCVLPGFLRTKFVEGMTEAAVGNALETHVLDDFNTPEAAARFILNLDGLPQVSGQVFQLDSRV